MRKVLVLNGPNLNMLGARQPEVYGHATLDDLRSLIGKRAQELNLEADIRQTSSEEELIGWIHEAFENKLDVVLNPAAFTHYSYALADACAMLKDAGVRLYEVHISNPHARESFRHTSVISSTATGVIAGFGTDGYLMALEALSRN